MRRLFILGLLATSLLGLSGTAFANEERIRPSIQNDQKAQAQEWFQGMGIDRTADGFAKDVLNLMTGIDQRLGRSSTSFTVSAGSRLRMGLKF